MDKLFCDSCKKEVFTLNVVEGGLFGNKWFCNDCLKKTRVLRGFWVVDHWNNEGFPLVAEDKFEAKKIGYKILCEKGIGVEWIDLRVTLIKNTKIDFSKYSKGQIEASLENLKNGIYPYFEGEKVCPRCGYREPERVEYDKDIGCFYCDICEYREKFIKGWFFESFAY